MYVFIYLFVCILPTRKSIGNHSVSWVNPVVCATALQEAENVPTLKGLERPLVLRCALDSLRMISCTLVAPHTKKTKKVQIKIESFLHNCLHLRPCKTEVQLCISETSSLSSSAGGPHGPAHHMLSPLSVRVAAGSPPSASEHEEDESPSPSLGHRNCRWPLDVATSGMNGWMLRAQNHNQSIQKSTGKLGMSPL